MTFAFTMTNQAARQFDRDMACRDIACPRGIEYQHAGAADRQGMIDFHGRVTVIERGGHQPGFETTEIVDDQSGAV